MALCFVSELDAQTHDTLLPAYGVRAGYGYVTHTGDHGVYDAFYDVPMGAIYLAPELVLYYADNYAYGFNLKFKGRLTHGESVSTFIDTGMQFMVWFDKAHFGVPFDLSVTYDLNSVLALEGTANYTPLLFLGGEPGRGLFSVLAGVRLQVQ